MRAATVLKESDLPPSCPLRRPAAMEAYRKAIQAGSALSLESRAVLAPMPPAELGRWLSDLMRRSRAVFQPWSMEIVFLAGVLGEVRFSVLEDLLGASSRTLANKLRTLCGAGLLERRVEAGPPTRITYRLTKQGRIAAAAASPLFAHLNLAALGKGGLAPPP